MAKKSQIQFPQIGVLSFAHMLNDLYSNYLPQMLPFLIAVNAGFYCHTCGNFGILFYGNLFIGPACVRIFSGSSGKALARPYRNIVDGGHAQHDRSGA